MFSIKYVLQLEDFQTLRYSTSFLKHEAKDMPETRIKNHWWSMFIPITGHAVAKRWINWTFFNITEQINPTFAHIIEYLTFFFSRNCGEREWFTFCLPQLYSSRRFLADMIISRSWHFTSPVSFLTLTSLHFLRDKPLWQLPTTSR